MKFISILAASFVFSINAFGQTSQKIRGIIANSEKSGVQGATVSLLSGKDSSVLKLSVSAKEGGFEFDDVVAGEYIVLASATGHQKTYSKKINHSGNRATEVATIEMPIQAKSMAGVTITSKKPLIEQKIDRMVLNVDASVTNVGATALEVLEKAPGVTVDKDGNISLKGKQGVMVMMDGRPSYLSGTELSNYLKGLPASAIEQIEIMTNPSAKYDASGNSGIINIKSKKNKQQGFNGSLSASIGRGQTTRTNNSLNLNYRTGKFNLFMNGGLGIFNNKQQLDILRKYKNASSGSVTAIFEQRSKMNNRSDNNNLKIGADYYLNKKTTIGIVTSGFYNLEDFNSENTSYFKSPSSKVDSINTTVANTNNTWKNGSVNLNMRHQFDSAGRELTADVDYINYSTASNLAFSSSSFDPSWAKKNDNRFRGNLPMDIAIYVGKMDYAQPLKGGAKLEAGAKWGYVKTTNKAQYFNQNASVEAIDYRKTNNFLYEEQIGAAYINWNKQYKKWGVQSGLRYEYTNYNGEQFGNPLSDSSFSKKYGSLFPTAFISYTANKTNQFALSFGRRIDRPAYQDLNPFMFYIDEYTYEAGNPYMKPQFTNNIEISHTYKGYLTTTLNYSKTTDYMNETFSQGDPAKGESAYATIVRDGNIGERQTAGIAVSAQVPVKKWWSANLYTNYNYNAFSGSINGSSERVDVAASNLMFNVNNQFKFNKGWGGEVSGFYRTKGVEGQILIQPMGQLSAGVSKQVLKGKGSVKMNIRDIFLTNYAQGDINFQTTEAHFVNRRDSRVANLSFTYRFGKPLKDAAPRRKIGGADDETNRVKVGGN